MQKPSRHMPPIPPIEDGQYLSFGTSAALFIALVVVPIGLGLWFNPRLTVGIAIAIVLVFSIMFAYSSIAYRRNFRRLMTGREDEGICEFARSFDIRRQDTRIIRAVYEGLVDWHAQVYGQEIPIRPSDNLCDDLMIGEEDLNDYLAEEIAVRAGREVKGWEANPLYGNVHTVRDLVDFLHHQPLRS